MLSLSTAGYPESRLPLLHSVHFCNAITSGYDPRNVRTFVASEASKRPSRRPATSVSAATGTAEPRAAKEAERHLPDPPESISRALGAPSVLNVIATNGNFVSGIDYAVAIAARTSVLFAIGSQRAIPAAHNNLHVMFDICCNATHDQL